MPEIVRAPVPGLLNVMVCAVAVAPATMLGNDRVVLSSVADGTGAVTVALNGIVADPPTLALLAIVSVAE